MSTSEEKLNNEREILDIQKEMLSLMKKRQGIGYVNISLDKVHEIRKKLPLLKNRRTDIYSDFKI